MLQCSFCKKTEDQVSKLVAGPDVYICNECVVIAARLMIEPRGFFRRFWDRMRSALHFVSGADLPASIDPGHSRCDPKTGNLVLRRLLHVIDDENFDWSLRGF